MECVRTDPQNVLFPANLLTPQWPVTNRCVLHLKVDMWSACFTARNILIQCLSWYQLDAGHWTNCESMCGLFEHHRATLPNPLLLVGHSYYTRETECVEKCLCVFYVRQELRNMKLPVTKSTCLRKMLHHVMSNRSQVSAAG